MTILHTLTLVEDVGNFICNNKVLKVVSSAPSFLQRHLLKLYKFKGQAEYSGKKKELKLESRKKEHLLLHQLTYVNFLIPILLADAASGCNLYKEHLLLRNFSKQHK